ncbi:MAG: adenosylcobinamide-GDP ribazoletransferase [Eubacteriales bacterium]|nr:adenosylcobinamide-GDP ribazoletransferase [Eubacteriales bacterium]
MNLLCGAVIAFSMYSKIPVPHIEWTKERMRYMFCFFPLIGGVIAALMLLWMRFGKEIAGDGTLFTAVFVLIPVLVTGGIHLDGYLDTSDALSSYKTMEEKLEILKDSHAGAFAVISGICYFVLYFGACGEMTWERIYILAPCFVLSRALSALAVVTFKKAKNSGLAASFSDMAQQRTVGVCMAVYILVCGIALIVIGKAAGLLVFAASLLTFVWYRKMAYRKFGGITGDLAGFFLQVCELVMILTSYIALRFV